MPLIGPLIELANRERRRILGEVTQVRGLMPLLMKPRNGKPWSSEDRRELVVHLRRISALGPYLVVFVMPGGFVVLPALAWWLDRRRKPRGPSTAAGAPKADSTSP